MHGMQVVNCYLTAKKKYPDIDEWLAISVMHEFDEEQASAILAMGCCYTTDRPWEDFRVFEKVVLVLNERLVFGDIIQDLDIKEIAYAICILKRLFPDKLFNDEIAKYIAIEATQEGFVVLPPELSFAQRFIPITYLKRDQEQIQALYLEEVEGYKSLMDGSDT